MERALIGTSYASTIIRFCKARYGNKDMAAIVSQHAGKDVWEKRIKHSEEYMIQKSWRAKRTRRWWHTSIGTVKPMWP